MADSYVGKPCPKCRYVRTATDTSPDWQCPKCGVAYAKFVQARSDPGAATLSRPANAGRAAVAAASGEGSTGLAMFAHLSIVIGWIVPFFGLIVPIVIWISKRDSDGLAVANAKEAINFQITMVIWALFVVGLFFLGMGSMGLMIAAALVGAALIIASIVLPIVAAVKAKGGAEFRYPLTAHIFG